jgi:hypothetical protein
VTALADLQTRIAFEIDRTDLTSAVAAAVTTAIKAHKFTRLPFNESSGTLTTAAGVGTYSTATAPPNALPSDILELDSARITTSASNRYLLEAVSWQTIDAIDNSGTHTSRPIWYAWHAEALRLYPAADGVYTIDLRYLADVAEETWASRAEALIRCRAKKEIYLHVLRDSGMAAAMEKIEGQELAALKREARLKQATGRIVPHD